MRGVEVHLGLRPPREPAVTPAHLDVALDDALDARVSRSRTTARHVTIGCPPGRGSTSNERSSKCSRQSQGVAMRRRTKPLAAAPSTKYGALPIRSRRHSIDSASAPIASRQRRADAAATCATIAS